MLRAGGVRALHENSKRGRRQVEYGLFTDPQGRPVAVEVFAGNTSDPVSFKTAITRVRDDFGVNNLIMVGDRGMITGTRIGDLRKLKGMDWITALKAPALAKLARGHGPLQMSLFDTQNFADHHPDYPGERLICCHNPVLAADRGRTREELLAATENDLATIRAAADAGRLKDPDKIGIRASKVINKHKVAKHFILDIGPGRFTWRRDEEKIAAEAALDGIYVIRTSVNEETLGSAGVVTAYKNLKYVERDFRITKADDLDLRGIYHYLAGRVRGHVLICMLACYLTWHLRRPSLSSPSPTSTSRRPATPSHPRSVQPGPKPKTPASTPPAGCPPTATATCSSTCPPSTGRPSTSPDGASANSPAPPPSSGGPSSFSARQYPRPPGRP